KEGAKAELWWGKEKARVFSPLAARGRAAGDELAMATQTAGRLLPHSRADVFDHNIRASPAGLATNFPGDFLRVVVEHHVGAELLRAAKFFFIPGHSKDASSSLLCDLNCGRAHAA